MIYLDGGWCIVMFVGIIDGIRVRRQNSQRPGVYIAGTLLHATSRLQAVKVCTEYLSTLTQLTS